MTHDNKHQFIEANFGYCLICGHPLAWGGSQDIGEDEEERQYDNYHCCNCGCDVEYWHPTEEEKANYPFWKEQKQKSLIPVEQNDKDNTLIV